ncbi:MAG: hypothetical protein ACRDTE_28175 [Pseudonocardiaceae bacterium]
MIDEWLKVAEHEDSTRETYLGYIERTIKPALGGMSITKLSARHLETLYAQLRRCRSRCDGKPLIDHQAPVVIRPERLVEQPGGLVRRRRIRLWRFLPRTRSAQDWTSANPHRTAAESAPLMMEWICGTVEAAIGLHVCGRHPAAT